MVKKQKKTSYTFLLFPTILVVIALVLKISYFQFSVWNATSVPNEDHAWFNLMLYPLTPTISDKDAYVSLQPYPEIVHIDVRDEKEYKAGHIPGAINIAEETLYTVIPQRFPDKNTLIYLNCNTGHKGAVSTRLLRIMGYTYAWNIQDGLEGWKEAGYPVVK